jgi:hypothetical protein
MKQLYPLRETNNSEGQVFFKSTAFICSNTDTPWKFKILGDNTLKDRSMTQEIVLVRDFDSLEQLYHLC